eukprot:TRINITY_DN4410_c0_g2_i1.p1 TRINITY_DN4410_c0_g2~~TRINITY_DN4410_c0_g2_i1.p1  ORF type:complete len:319 (-),score=63.82 TRINITY_DN4410_c0_g2_i1:50-1006(-)
MTSQVGDPKELTAEIHKALELCKEENIWEAIECLKVIPITEEASKGEKICAIENAILHTYGPQRFVRALETSEKNLNQLQSLYQACKLPASSTPETLRAHISEIGVYSFLDYFLPNSRSLLRSICEALGLPEREAAEDMVKSIADEIMLGGSENFLTALQTSTLEKFAADLGINPTSSVSHEKLVDNLMVKIFELEPYDAFQKLLHGESEDEGKPPDTTPKKRKRDDDFNGEKGSAKKPKGKGKYVCPPLENIKKGTTAEQLRDLYNVTDLQEWCKQHDLPPNGKKSLVIRNILHFLETGEKPKSAKKGKKGGKRTTL